MLKITWLKNVLMVFSVIAFLAITGCKGLQKPGEFVESLRNPTSFPEIFHPEIKHIDEVVSEKGLSEGENVKVVPLGSDKSSSLYLFQIRENAVMDAHYHKSHDEIVYIKEGSGILEIEGTRHSVTEGTVVVIPRLSGHKYVNTGTTTSVAVSIFSPPFDGEDIRVIKEYVPVKRNKKNIYDKYMEKSEKEKEKEEGGGKKWFGLWGKGEAESVSGAESGELTGDVTAEEQKILVLTEEGRQKIREARQKIKEEERAVIAKIILDEKLKALQKLKDDGLISQEEFEDKKAEIIGEGVVKD